MPVDVYQATLLREPDSEEKGTKTNRRMPTLTRMDAASLFLPWGLSGLVLVIPNGCSCSKQALGIEEWHPSTHRGSWYP